MIAAELRGDNRPNLNEALGWIGSRVDDIYGAQIGRLEDVWIDPGTGQPRWLLIKEGRFGGRATLIPFEDATAGAGHVWVPYERDVVRDAPQIEPGAPLTQQVEISLRRHYAANSPAAFERAEELGSTPHTATSPSDDPLASAEDRPSARMPDRPAPPVAAPDREPGDPGEERKAPEGRPRPEEAEPAAESSRPNEPSDRPPPPQGWEQGPPPPTGYPGYPSWPPPPNYFQPTPWPYPPAPYGVMPYPPPGYPAPMPPGYAAASAPLAGLAGREVEIELEGPVRISGTVRSVRFKPESE